MFELSRVRRNEIRRLGCLIVIALLLAACRPAPDVHEAAPAIVLDFPLRGEWRLLRPPGHDAFAYDLAATGGPDQRLLRRSRWQHLLGRTTAEDSYSWGQVVNAPGTGEVVAATDGWPDRVQLHLIRDAAAMLLSAPRLNPEDIRPFAGNYLILRIDTVYVFLAHLRSGSLQVDAGDSVVSGQPLAQVGNSGHTLEPHLHLEVFDQVHDLLGAHTLRFHVREFERWTGQVWERQRNAPLVKGERVRFAPEGGVPPGSRLCPGRLDGRARSRALLFAVGGIRVAMSGSSSNPDVFTPCICSKLQPPAPSAT